MPPVRQQRTCCVCPSCWLVGTLSSSTCSMSKGSCVCVCVLHCPLAACCMCVAMQGAHQARADGRHRRGGHAVHSLVWPHDPQGLLTRPAAPCGSNQGQQGPRRVCLDADTLTAVVRGQASVPAADRQALQHVDGQAFAVSDVSVLEAVSGACCAPPLNQSCSSGAPLSLPACSALLFCSPEVYTSNHKTEILDEAFDAVLKRLGAPRNKHLIRDRLWVRDTQGRWCESSDAGELLVQHHKQHWAPLVRCTYPLLCLASHNFLKRVGCQLTCGATVSEVVCLIQHDCSELGGCAVLEVHSQGGVAAC